MNYGKRIQVTAAVMFHALFSSRQLRQSRTREFFIGEGAEIAPEAISYVIANLPAMVRRDGTLELNFSGCLAPAAPCLLFRLKRLGFSTCRATISTGGLLLSAIR